MVGMRDETEGMTRVHLRLTSRARTLASEIHKGIFNVRSRLESPKGSEACDYRIGGNGGRFTLKEHAPAAAPLPHQAFSRSPHL